LRFAAIAGGVFVVSVLLYPWIAPAYRLLVRGLGNFFLAALPDPAGIEAHVDGGWKIVPLSGNGTVFFVTPDDLDLNHAALILLPALLLATPGPLRARLRRLGLGLAILLLLHAISLVPWVAALRCLRHDPDDLVCTYAYSTFGAGSQIYAFVVWAALTWRTWLPTGSLRQVC
jgi:hypothetical protein